MPIAPSATELPPEIFKAYDIRGIVGKTLTPATVERIGHAIGSEARARSVKTVVVGRDGRLSGPELAAALSRGLNAAGCDVIDIGRVPTPVLYFATHHLGTHSGVSITGSHNPPEYNGLKVMLAGETLSGEAIQGLRQRLLTNDLAHGDGWVTQSGCARGLSCARHWRREARAQIARRRGLRQRRGRRTGAKAHAQPGLRGAGALLRDRRDVPEPPPRPGASGEPARPDRGGEKNKLDVGLAFDGDGDRLGVITPDGDIVWPDRQMILYARDMLSRQPGAEIVYDVKCTRTLPEEIRKAGGKPTMWKTGHSFIKAKLKETGAALGGEMSGHIFFKERWYGFDDALYTGARLLELLSRDPRPTHEVFASLPNTVNTPELHLKMAEGEHYALIKELAAQASFPDAKVTTIDGVRADFPDGFGLVRASNTTPVLVFRFEGDNAAALERIQLRFRELVASVRPGIKLPF